MEGQVQIVQVDEHAPCDVSDARVGHVRENDVAQLTEAIRSGAGHTVCNRRGENKTLLSGKNEPSLLTFNF